MVAMLQDSDVQGSIRKGLEALFDISAKSTQADLESAAPGLHLLEWLRGKDDIDDLLKVFPNALQRIVDNWDALTETLIIGCLEPDADGTFVALPFDELSYQDGSRLRSAVFECNDFRGMLETEKNSLVGAFSQMMNLGAPTGNETPSPQSGGLGGKPSSLQDSPALSGSAR